MLPEITFILPSLKLSPADMNLNFSSFVRPSCCVSYGRMYINVSKLFLPAIFCINQYISVAVKGLLTQTVSLAQTIILSAFIMFALYSFALHS